MAITGTATSYLTKANVLTFVRAYLYKEPAAIAGLRALRGNYKSRARRAHMVNAMYKAFFIRTSVTGVGDVFDQQSTEDKYMILSWFNGEIGLQLSDQAYTGTTS